jgi:hypothetical protein
MSVSTLTATGDAHTPCGLRRHSRRCPLDETVDHLTPRHCLAQRRRRRPCGQRGDVEHSRPRGSARVIRPTAWKTWGGDHAVLTPARTRCKRWRWPSQVGSERRGSPSSQGRCVLRADHWHCRGLRWPDEQTGQPLSIRWSHASSPERTVRDRIDLLSWRPFKIACSANGSGLGWLGEGETVLW